MKKVLMICLGNICRSPLAEGILQSKVNKDKVFVDSAGTGGYHIGNAPDPRSIEVALQNGLDISHQKCRKFTVEDFDNFDFIYVMDKGNYMEINNASRKSSDMDKVKLIMEEVKPNANLSVPDPYFGADNGFENVFKMLDEACEKIANKLN